MNIRNIAAGAGVAAIVLGAVLPAAALTVNTNSATNVTGSAGITGTGTSGSATNASGSATTGVNVGVDVNGSGNGNTSGSSTNSSGSITGNVGITESASNDSLMITRADIDSNAVDSTSWNSRSAAEVQTSADLKAYVASQMKSDSNLSAVESNSSDVAVTYNQRGRFLGFIPITLKATALVDQNGQVTVTYPWYAFLATTDRADLVAKLQAAVNAMASASASGAGTAGASSTTPNAAAATHANANASFELTADTQARIVAEMRRIMNEELTASGSVAANASASAGANQ